MFCIRSQLSEIVLGTVTRHWDLLADPSLPHKSFPEKERGHQALQDHNILIFCLQGSFFSLDLAHVDAEDA